MGGAVSGRRRGEMSGRRHAPATGRTSWWVLAGIALLALGTVSCFRGKPALPVPAPPSVPTSITITAPPNAKVKAPMTVATGADTNPDSAGRPSPVVIRVYQLRTDAAFSKVEFFALFDDDQKVLGQELISRDEFVLAPSENVGQSTSPSRTTRDSWPPSPPSGTSATRSGAPWSPPLAAPSR